MTTTTTTVDPAVAATAAAAVLDDDYSIIAPSAVFQEHWPSYSVLPQGLHGALSVAGWTSGNEGFVQQTFLGASLRSFNVNAGFGDTSSTMGLELVNDEFNTSDGTNLGEGDDVYHDGKKDHFMPPVVGSPVFFKFGKNYASIEQAFRRTLDETYEINTLEMPEDPFPIIIKPLPVTRHEEGHYLLEKDFTAQTVTTTATTTPIPVGPTLPPPTTTPSPTVTTTNYPAGIAKWVDKSLLLDPGTKWRGFSHFAFGGILQSYTENRGPAGNPLYSVKLVDPREILSNTELLFNNYQGTTFNNKNLYNVYGFLEYDPSDALIKEFDDKSSSKEILTKNIDDQGKVTFEGVDKYLFATITPSVGLGSPTVFIESLGEISEISGEFPITGQGFSRRSDNGIPWYRVDQALTALFDYNGELPKEYRDSGFGGVVDFRGYNYVVDWTGIPTDEIPKTYYLDFDQINMLDLAQELCDVLSRDLFVSLLPVIDHPACKFLYDKNQKVIEEAKALAEDERALVLGSGLVAGIIRIDTIDRSKQPTYGKVKEYLDDLESKDIFVENRDVGFEVSNVTTDKFIVGAQEVEMYYFNGLRDRDNYLERLKDHGVPDAAERLQVLNHDKWTLPTNLNQQIIPFYGFIGDKAVSIPRGFGSWQQILLDARHLNAYGVGAYYIATEMELRAASVSFKAWSKFLMNYDEVYIQETSENQGFYASFGSKLTVQVDGINNQLDSDSPIKQQLDQLKNRNFAVAVPRCVWNSDKSPNITHEPVIDLVTGNPVTDSDGNIVTEEAGGPFEGKMGNFESGNEGFPASPCSPPFGYPLYYKRAQSIGIPQAGLTSIHGSITTILTNVERLENKRRSDRQRFSFNSDKARSSLKKIEAAIAEFQSRHSRSNVDGASIDSNVVKLQARMKKIKENLIKARKDLKTIAGTTNVAIANLKKVYKGQTGIIKNLSRYDRQHLQNAKRVYNFVKKIADDNLGKKFLVKIPRATNVFYANKIKSPSQYGYQPWDILKGPFGFDPQPISTIPDYKGDDEWKAKITAFKRDAKTTERDWPPTTPLDGSTAGTAQPHISPIRSNIHWHYLDTEAMGEASTENGNAHATPYGSGYTYGALKTNYNPMTEKWEFNYAPEPQGGFFNFALYDKNLSALEAAKGGVADAELPTVTRNVLAPKLLTKLITDGNRIHCYARYDHSENLDFSNVSTDSVEQQSIVGDTIIPDVMETLPNLNPDQRASLDQIQARTQDDKELERQAESVAFVKCDLDEDFYMAPKVVLNSKTTIWAEQFNINIAEPTYDVVWVKDERPSLSVPNPLGLVGFPTIIDNPNSGCQVPREVIPRIVPSFGVPSSAHDTPVIDASGNPVIDASGNPVTEKIGGAGGKTVDCIQDPSCDGNKITTWDDFDREWSDTYKGWIIKTEAKDLDPQHVYALITVPGKIIPTIDSRYVDGPLKALNAVSISNAMTEDVVKIKEFEYPLGIDTVDDPIDCKDFSDVDFSFEDVVKAIQAQKAAVKGITMSTPNESSNLSFSAPSPIYPDIVAIPLISLERCYGPWLSSALDGKILGRGDITYSDIGGKIEFIKEEKLAPWNYAGYQLMDEAAKLKSKFSNSLLLFSERGSFSYADAPIGVSLAKALRDKGPLVTSISVDISQTIKTSVKLDLYTSQFGKMQKQKEIAISQISRERQKMIDKNNILERRGMAKGAARGNMTGDLLKKGGQKLLDIARDSTEFLSDLEKGKEPRPSLLTISAKPSREKFEDSDGESHDMIVENYEGMLQTYEQLQEMGSSYWDRIQAEEAANQTTGKNLSELFKGTGPEGDPVFANERRNRQQQMDARVYDTYQPFHLR